MVSFKFLYHRYYYMICIKKHQTPPYASTKKKPSIVSISFECCSINILCAIYLRRLITRILAYQHILYNAFRYILSYYIIYNVSATHYISIIILIICEQFFCAIFFFIFIMELDYAQSLLYACIIWRNYQVKVQRCFVFILVEFKDGATKTHQNYYYYKKCRHDFIKLFKEHKI